MAVMDEQPFVSKPTPSRLPQRREATRRNNTEQHRILFFVNDGVGHINGSLGLASRLRDLGHIITYLGVDAVRPHVEGQGFSFVELPHLQLIPTPHGIRRRPSLPRRPFSQWLQQELRNIALGREQNRLLLSSIDKIISETDRIVSTLHPTILVFDPFLLLYYLPFVRHHIPTAVLSTKPLLHRDSAVPPYTSHLIPSGTFASNIQIAAAWQACTIKYRIWDLYESFACGYSLRSLFDVIASRCNRALGGEWMSRGVIFDIHMRSLPELVLHAREFDFPARGPSERAIYVGPCVQTERIEAPFRWEIVGVRRHLALCTLSTVAHASALPKRRAFFEKLMLAIATLPEVTLIVALGPKVEVPHSPEAPGNIRFFRNVPQLAVLRRADLLITHAGSNSVK